MTVTEDQTQPTELPEPDLYATRLAAFRGRLEWQIAVIDAVAMQPDLEPPEPYYYTAPTWTWTPSSSSTDEENRAEALRFLARHARGLLAVANELGIPAKLEKLNPDADGSGDYGVRLMALHPADGDLASYDEARRCVYLAVRVPSSVTCELVPTGDYDEIPAQPAQRVPRMQRRCPTSIFAGVTDEMEAPLAELIAAPADPDPEPF